MARPTKKSQLAKEQRVVRNFTTVLLMAQVTMVQMVIYGCVRKGLDSRGMAFAVKKNTSLIVGSEFKLKYASL